MATVGKAAAKDGRQDVPILGDLRDHGVQGRLEARIPDGKTVASARMRRPAGSARRGGFSRSEQHDLTALAHTH